MVLPTLELLTAPGVWHNLTADLIRDPLRWRRGITGAGPTDRLQGPGSLTFALDNTAQNAAETPDYYTPGHVDALAEWRHGAVVRLRISNGIHMRYVFRGRLRSILPEPAIAGLYCTTCLAVDWFEEFADLDAVDLVLREDVSEADLIDDLVALAETTPANVDMDPGLDAYEFAFDDLGGGTPKAPEVAAAVLNSCLGYLYLRGDDDEGETLRFENRHARALVAPLYSFDLADLPSSTQALQVPSDQSQIFNVVEVLSVPRRVDAAATTVLIRMDSPIEVGPGEVVRQFLDYKDPSNEAEYVGGKDIVPPAPVTDWTANADREGGGVDVTASVAISVAPFGSRAMLEITNGSGSVAFVRGPGTDTGLRVRGRGLYRYRPVSLIGESEASIDRFGRRPLPSPILLPYQGDRNIGFGIAEFLAHVHGGLMRAPQSIQLEGTNDPALEEPAICLDLGDAIEVPAQVGTVKAFLHAGAWELRLEGVLSVEYALAPADTTNVLVLDDTESGRLDFNKLAFA